MTSRSLIARILQTSILSACLACAQTAATQSTVVHLTNTPSEPELTELATMLQEVTGSPYLSSNAAQSTIAVTGTPGQLALAEWLSKQVDKPADWKPTDSEYANPAARQYKLQGEPAEVAGVFYLRNTPSPRALQSITMTLDNVLDASKRFQRSQPRMIAYRAGSSEANLIEWLLPRLDIRSADLTHPTAKFKMPAPAPDGSDDIIEVFCLTPPIAPKEYNNLLRTLRAGHINKSFGIADPPVLVVRGTPAQLSAAEQLILMP